MDRRHVVLGFAIGASVATSYSTSPLFRGEAQSDAVFTLDVEHPERVWLITYTADLPQEVGAHPFSSSLEVGVAITRASTPAPIEFVLWDAATFETIGQGDSMYVPDPFADCLPGRCERAFFLYVSSPEEVDAGGYWMASAWIRSDEPAPDVDESKEVPITIEYEELAL